MLLWTAAVPRELFLFALQKDILAWKEDVSAFQVVKALLILRIFQSKQQAHWAGKMVIPNEDLEVLFLILGFIAN